MSGASCTAISSPRTSFWPPGRDGSIVPKLLDFGVAKLDTEPGLTRTGAVVGTPSHMSPEQAIGEGDVSPEVPQALGWAIDRALQRQAGSRHPSMQAFARALLAAGLREQLILPSAPDPIGLPDWSRWLTGEQNVASTSAVDKVERSDVAPLETPLAAPHTAVRWLAALMVAALLALGATFAVRLQAPAEARRPLQPAASPPMSPTPQPTRPSATPPGVSGHGADRATRHLR